MRCSHCGKKLRSDQCYRLDDDISEDHCEECYALLKLDDVMSVRDRLKLIEHRLTAIEDMLKE